MRELKFLKSCVLDQDERYAQFIVHSMELCPEIHGKHCQGLDQFEACIETHQPEIISIDITENIQDNDKIFRLVREKCPHAVIIIISSVRDTSVIFHSVKAGVFAFIEKNQETKNKITKLTQEIVALCSSTETVPTETRKPKRPKYTIRSQIIGESSAIRNLDELIEKASFSAINVLITGETGTGKELVAKCIHMNSSRSKQPLVTVNMAAIPHELAESELFGHEKGAFTGASFQRPGKFELADGGTIFLDEIGEMDISLQAKLLRVLQEKELVRIGGSKTIKVNCRVITATNKHLPDEVSEGKFREDLYYRLYGLCVHLPPLRDRGRDKILIAEFLIENYCKENNLKSVSLSEDAKSKIMQHTFPGNIRELKSCVELAVVMSDGNEIKPGDIRISNNLNFKKLISEEKTLDDYQREIIRHFLERYDRNVVKVAERLAIGKSTIYRMLKEEADFFEMKS